MATLLDIIFATILGGFLLLILINANFIASESSTTYNNNVLVQMLLVSNIQLIEGEFKNMGSYLPDSVRTIIYAAPTGIKFLTAKSFGAAPDTISYQLSPLQTGIFQNDSIRFIYRKVNNNPQFSIGMATQFSLKYYDQDRNFLGSIVPDDELASIKLVEMTVEVQSPHGPYRNPNEVKPGERDALFSSSMWRQTRLASQNLYTR